MVQFLSVFFFLGFLQFLLGFSKFPVFLCHSVEINLIFIFPCIANIIPNYKQQDSTFLNLFISTDALHVSGGSSAHHQGHITIHTTSGIFNQYYCWLQPEVMRSQQRNVNPITHKLSSSERMYVTYDLS